MGELIQLAERREARRTRTQTRPATVRADFMFDLACPFTYLVAERVERAFDDVRWMPASTTALRAGSLGSDAAATDAVRVAAEQRAVELRMPLVWPETFPVDVPAAMRVAAHAAELRPRRGVRAGRRPARILRRLRPRRSRDPVRGGRGRRARRSTTPSGGRRPHP